MPAYHAFPSVITDDADANKVRPSDWNAAHVIDVDLATESHGILPLASISGLTVAQFASPNISQWTNNSGYLTSISGLDHGSLGGLGDDDHTQYHNDSRALTWLGTRSTSDLTEGSRLYYTDVRADARITVQKGAVSGIAPLDVNSKIPTTYLPALALTDVFAVASQVAQLALTAEEGDVAIRSDLNKSYIHNGGVAGTMADWSELLTPTDSVLSVNGMTGAVTVSTITGNAGTATALQTPRTINGVNFDGTANITVTAAAGTLTGTTLASNVVTTTITGVGIITASGSGWNAPGSVRLNGGNSTGFENVANANTARFGAVLTSNTPGHHALFVAEVAGSSSGSDPFTNYKNSNAGTDAATGTDTSDAGAYKVSMASTLGTNDAFKITTAGTTSVLLGNFDVTRSASAANVTATVSNTNNASGTANAINIVSVGGASSGDPSWQCAISGVTTVSGGLDNSDSDSYKEQFSATVGTTPHRVVTTAGEQTLPLQPAFLAYKTGGAGNITGDGTTVTPVIDSEVFDQNADYNNSTSTFTAPVTGKYIFSGAMLLQNLAAAHTLGSISIVTSNRTYFAETSSVGVQRSSINELQVQVTAIADMDAGDTAVLSVSVSNSTKTVGIAGSATPSTRFSGYLLC